MEDALGAAEGDRHRQAHAADREQPAGARVGALEAGDDEHADPSRDGGTEQPPGLAAERLVEQPHGPGLAAEHAAGATAARAAAAPRSAVLAEEPSEAVVAEDQRPDAVVARARHPRTVGGRGQPDQDRPGQPDRGHRRATRGEAADGGRAAAGRDPQIRGDQRRHHEQRRRHLGLEAEADGDSRTDDPPRPPVLEPAHHEPQRGGAAQHEQRVGIVVAEDGDGHRGEHQRQPGDEARGAAEAPVRRVVGERDGPDAHQRLRDEHAPGAEAERARGQRLHPEGERRLVDGHHSSRVERAIQERVPARAHRAHGGAVVLVGEAVAIERPQVEHARGDEQHGELGAREREGRGPDALTRAGEGQRGGRHGHHLRPSARERAVTTLGVG